MWARAPCVRLCMALDRGGVGGAFKLCARAGMACMGMDKAMWTLILHDLNL